MFPQLNIINLKQIYMQYKIFSLVVKTSFLDGKLPMTGIRNNFEGLVAFSNVNFVFTYIYWMELLSGTLPANSKSLVAAKAILAGGSTRLDFPSTSSNQLEGWTSRGVLLMNCCADELLNCCTDELLLLMN